ncbi:MAG: flagellar hook-associated protein FlgL [Woeseiaceae bacterium]|nr:flagellar hook-associated protein FlgL [Woeseiaceae bacterium]
MRVSNQGSYLLGLQAMQRLQQALDVTQRQISSGRRILNPSDDPIGSARAIDLRESISRIEQFDRNATIAGNRLSQEEATLGSVNNVLQRVRELTLQANNATQSNETRKLIAVEIREHLDNLQQLANQKDGNGNYLFAGNQVDTRPVTRTGSLFTYNGDQGQRRIQIGEGRELADSDPGSEVFFRVRTGIGSISVSAAGANTGTGMFGTYSVTDPTQYDAGTYEVRFIDPANYEVLDSGGGVVTSGTFATGDNISFRGVELTITGAPAANDVFTVEPSQTQSMFATIDNLASAMESAVYDDQSRAAMNNMLNEGLLNLDQALGNILDVRTRVGSRLAAIENQVDSNGATKLSLQATLAEIRDLDYAEAISRLSAESAALEAAQKTFTYTQQLSLFNYL